VERWNFALMNGSQTLNRCQAIYEIYMFFALLLFSAVLYNDRGTTLDWSMMLAPLVLNLLRILLVSPSPWLGRWLRVSDGEQHLRIGIMGAFLSGVICFASLWAVIPWLWMPLSSRPPRPWGESLTTATLITQNLILSTLWLKAQYSQERVNGDMATAGFDWQEEARQSHGCSPSGHRPKPDVTFLKLFDSTAGWTGLLCAICLDEFSTGCTVGRLSCGHVFHDECARKWLQNEPRCPMRCSTTPSPPPCEPSFETASAVIGRQPDDAV
jgi:hypothetical protein